VTELSVDDVIGTTCKSCLVLAAAVASAHFSDGTPFNDNISSIDNNTGVTVHFYTDASFGGTP
jgi:hypothetical protein